MNTFANAFMDATTITHTENGAVTYSTSNSTLVDMFFLLGGKRGANYEQIVKIVDPAFKEDPSKALRIALYNRDVRQGQGERQIFRHIIRYLFETNQNVLLVKAFNATLDLGRADDLFTFMEYGDDMWKVTVANRIMYEIVNKQNALVAKWVPRKGPINKYLQKFAGVTPKQFRKLLVSTTNVVETKMCDNDWGNIDYSGVPGNAMKIYSRAFGRHDQEGFTAYLESVKTGKVNVKTGKVEKINAGVVYPHEVVRMNDQGTKDAMWDNLPNYIPEGLSFLPLIDLSSSMHSLAGGSDTTVDCMTIAMSLGMYMAERNTSAFKNLYLTFDNAPQFRALKGNTLNEKIQNLDYDNWGGSTDLNKAFFEIATMAKLNNVPTEDMPKFLVVLSDMEFNAYGNKAPGQAAQEIFTINGYKVPNIIWWNIQSRGNTVPVRAGENGMALVSGFSPSVMQNVCAGEVTPYAMMMKTIMDDRYSY